MADQESLSGLMRPEDQTAATASAPVISPPTVTRTESPDNDHGNRFQSKLLLNFFMRAINNRYQFHLGTELKEYGGKFDDLIFLKDYGQSIQSFLYLQAKHRKEETEAKNITTAGLLGNKKGDFSLIKYFHSYYHYVMKAKGRVPKPLDKVDGVICTNVDFDVKDLAQNKIKLVKLSQEELSMAPRELIAFNPILRKPTMNKTGRNLKTKDTNNLKYVANYLHMWAHNPEKTPPCLPNNSFQKYFDELLKNNRIVSPFPPVETEPMTFHRDFIDDAPSLSTDAKELRDYIVKRSKSKGNEDGWKNWKFHVAIKTPTCYRLEPIRWLDMHYVANVLRDYADNPKKALDCDEQEENFKSYQAALVKEKVIVHRTIKTFRPSFIDTDVKLSSVFAEKFRDIIVGLVPDGSWKNWMFLCSTDGANRATSTTDGNNDDDLKELANHLHELAANPTKLLDERGDLKIEHYYNVLMKESVLVSGKEKMTMHPDFINGTGLSTGAKALKNIIDKLVTPSGSWTKWKFSFNKIDSFKDQLGPHKSLDDPDTKNKIEDFFKNQLIFAVNTPNEEELNPILKEEEGEYLSLRDTDLQSAFILSEMVNWFKRRENGWLSAKEGEKILLEKTKEKMDSLRATSLSLDYQEELSYILSFNEAAVKEMAEKLKHLLCRSELLEEFKVDERITTATPKLTAVKVIAALRHQIISESMKPNFERGDSYLVTSTSRLKKGRESEWIRNTFTKEGNPQQLLIVVCDDDDGTENRVCLFNRKDIDSVGLLKKKFIIIERVNNNEAEKKLTDTIVFGQLSDGDGGSANSLLDRSVSFQGHNMTVEDLFGSEGLNKIEPTDFPQVLEELLTKEIEIPGFADENLKRLSEVDRDLEKNLYTDRRLLYPFKSKLQFVEKRLNTNLKKLRKNESSLDPLEKKELKRLEKIERRLKDAGNGSSSEAIENIFQDDLEDLQFTIDTDGRIEGHENDWGSIKSVCKEPTEPENCITEKDFISQLKWKGRAVIISGVAGTGKSTFLTHFYSKIKETESGQKDWVIVINLADHCKAFAQVKSKNHADEQSSLIDYLAGLSIIHNNSSFALSLLSHRLKTGEGIVVMLDAFDEIDSQSQEIMMDIMKDIQLKKSAGLLVMTRSHLNEQLQDQLLQLAYTLDNFSYDDQVKYLCKYWEKKLLEIARDDSNKNERIKAYVIALLKKVSDALKDEERKIFGIPLQCRILGECFQVGLKEKLENSGSFENISFQKTFDLVSLFEYFMQTKREVLRKEKCLSPQNLVLSNAIDVYIEKVESYLKKLALETMVEHKEDVDILWPPSMQESEADKAEDDKNYASYGIQFGLIASKSGNTGKIQFLHRTYAEYLVAQYIYKGFHLEKGTHSKLLEDENICRKIVGAVLMKDDCDGVRVFFNSMLGKIVSNDRWPRNLGDPDGKVPERLKKFAQNLWHFEITKPLSPDFEKQTTNLKKIMDNCLIDVDSTSKTSKRKPNSKQKKIYYDNELCSSWIYPGYRFELKLTLLFYIRAIKKEYLFQLLGSDDTDSFGKFDDIIFKYQVDDTHTGGKQERYRCLQIKHVLRKSVKITTSRLLEDDIHFSLKKYFLSYREKIMKFENLAGIQECVICTNIGFEKEEKLKENGIELIQLTDSDDILDFPTQPKVPVRYKLKKTDKLRTEMLKWLPESQSSSGTDVNESHEDIVNSFLEKLVFLVNMPNEEELTKILSTEVGELGLCETDFQSPYTLSHMISWFKQEKSMWLSANNGSQILPENMKMKMDFIRANSLYSLQFRRKLSGLLEFNEAAILEMAKKLEPLLHPNATNELQVTYIKTKAPELTAAKVIAGLATLNYNHEDSFLITSSSRLKSAHEKELMKKALLNEKNPQQLLIVVCDDDALIYIGESDQANNLVSNANYIVLFNKEESETMMTTNKVIVIVKERDGHVITDEVLYGHVEYTALVP